MGHIIIHDSVANVILSLPSTSIDGIGNESLPDGGNGRGKRGY